MAFQDSAGKAFHRIKVMLRGLHQLVCIHPSRSGSSTHAFTDPYIVWRMKCDSCGYEWSETRENPQREFERAMERAERFHRGCG